MATVAASRKEWKKLFCAYDTSAFIVDAIVGARCFSAWLFCRNSDKRLVFVAHIFSRDLSFLGWGDIQANSQLLSITSNSVEPSVFNDDHRFHVGRLEATAQTKSLMDFCVNRHSFLASSAFAGANSEAIYFISLFPSIYCGNWNGKYQSQSQWS